MSRTKKILLTLLAYLTAFIAAVCVSSFVLNQGKVSGEQQRSSADLPLLYVRTGGELMNEMHGYTEPVDGGSKAETVPTWKRSMLWFRCSSNSKTHCIPTGSIVCI